MIKSNLVVFALVTLIIAGDASASAASLPKPGTKCAIAGLTQTIAGKKFTCIKSGVKLTWNKGVAVAPKATPSIVASVDPTLTSGEPSPISSPIVAIVKYKNCNEAKAAGAAPLTKAKTPELYELNSGLDRDKDGIACES